MLAFTVSRCVESSACTAIPPYRSSSGRNAGSAWAGDLSFVQQSTTIANLVAPGTPAYDAGLEQDDAITAVDGRYRIDNVPPGSYNVIAWNEGLASDPKSVTVPDGTADMSS